MTDTTLAPRPASRMLSPAALLGAGVLLASLGAAAGWMMHDARPASDAEAARLALAPNESIVPQAPAAVLNEQRTPATAGPSAETAAPAKAPRAAATQRPARPAPRAQGAEGSTSGSGTSRAEPVVTQRAAVCDHCGVVEGVRAFQRKGEASGVGAVAGGVIGGLLGNKVGGGNGRKAMTVVGAVGGGLAGHEIEKRVKSETLYEVRVRMDDGSLRTLTQRSAPTPGTRVVVEGNTLRAASSRDTDNGGMVRTAAQSS
ncbi:MAG: glycine zipper 2TM domain-containing protein [Pseudomonadota bacterium]